MKFFLFIVILSSSLFAIEPIQPLPLYLDDIDLAKAKLGRLLFSDPSLSRDGSVSCNSCHDLSLGGADARDVSLGIENKKGNIQSPTVLNARYNFKQFWNGRVTTLREQADGPLHNPVEMAMDREKVEKYLNQSSAYKQHFAQVYKEQYITYENTIDAIVEFEKALVTPRSRFDQFLYKEIKLSEDESKGYMLFKTLGCVSCHNGINVGGNSFQKFGLLNNVPHYIGTPDRYAVTKNIRDKNIFKVPTLRNIEHTAPYFHDASSKTLYEAIKKMGFLNLGITLQEHEINELVAFLKSLSGEQAYILRED
ncbi:MAG: cytochrome c peroxidase [Campylobacterota bacterium]|nr:cytochrome c peroxidase [Campylobacterota bacterium]